MNREQVLELIRETSLFKWFKKTYFQTNIKDYNQNILDNLEVNKYIKELLLNDKPTMISRIGSTELRILENYYSHKTYSEHNKHTIEISSGVFPTDDQTLDKFAKLNFDRISNIDLLGIWFNPFEDVVANEFCSSSKLTILRNLEPYFSDNPWSYYLKDKKVLVIHPFISSIALQYSKREKLFKNQNVLPKFELIQYKPIQSFAGMATDELEYKSWFDALNKMEKDIEKIDFDVAIIAAGAYGLPLASFIKDIGKKAIHLGGATQMLFGVYGKRWENHLDFKDIINENWIKPLNDEKPKTANLLGKSSYW
ncbi:MAG TPA: hypothetical protein ENK66_09525 [Arcobacter sp.]|nr:hypothetical protein [Arcobacter sp.]